MFVCVCFFFESSGKEEKKIRDEIFLLNRKRTFEAKLLVIPLLYKSFFSLMPCFRRFFFFLSSTHELSEQKLYHRFVRDSFFFFSVKKKKSTNTRIVPFHSSHSLVLKWTFYSQQTNISMLKIDAIEKRKYLQHCFRQTIF